MGDFNYRIDLPGDDVKRAVLVGDLSMLLQEDQLLKQKDMSKVIFTFIINLIYRKKIILYFRVSDESKESCWMDEKRSVSVTQKCCPLPYQFHR